MWKVPASRLINRLLGGANNTVCYRVYWNHHTKWEKIIDSFFGKGHVRETAIWEARHKATQTDQARPANPKPGH